MDADDRWKPDIVSSAEAIPVPENSFDSVLCTQVLEHVAHPQKVVAEIFRVLKPGGRVLLTAPQWNELHEIPHDYFRYTRYGLDYLLARCGFTDISITPVGGFFRLLSRRLLNGVQFFPGPLALVAAVAFAPPALVLPLFDGLDRRRNFTLGHICTARKP
jgi:SAM-dependent methyltransferase